MFAKLVQIGFCALVLTACGSQQVKDEQDNPSWVYGESREYPRKQYLFGVGEADTMTAAKSRARAEIAKIFSVDIQAGSQDHSRYENLNLGHEKGLTESLSVSQSIDINTEQRVQGIEIPEVWLDKNNQRYYALAVLPRQKTAASLRNDITALDSATNTIVTNSRASTSLFHKVRLSSRAIALQRQRSQLADQLSVVVLTGNNVAVKWHLQKMIVDYTDLLSRITVRTLAQGLEKEKMKTVLSNALANDGMTVSEAGEYTIVLTLASSELGPKGAWYYNKATLTVSVIGKEDRTLGGNTWDYKVSATDASLSKIRVMEQAAAILEKELTKEIFSLME